MRQHTSPTEIHTRKARAAELGWVDIQERYNRRGKTLGLMGRPPNYTGPLLNIYVERLRDNYSPPSWGAQHSDNQ